MRISDWSSDVCSSDLSNGNGGNALFGPCKVEQAITSITYVGGPAYVEPAAGSAERPIFARIRRELMTGQRQTFPLDGREIGLGSVGGGGKSGVTGRRLQVRLNPSGSRTITKQKIKKITRKNI